MIPAISRDGMIEVDRIMVEDLKINVPLMMEHAGLNLAKIVKKFSKKLNGNEIIVVAGSGNNGGGGIVCARRLFNWGENVKIWLPKGKPMRSIPTEQLDRALNCGVKVVYDQPEINNSLFVDAFIGYNFTGILNGEALRIVKIMRHHDVICLDLPSGIDSTTGENHGKLTPLATLTLAWVKTGLLAQDPDNLGNLFLADIGIPSWVFQRENIFENSNSTSKEQISKIYQKFSKKSFLPISIYPDGWNIIE